MSRIPLLLSVAPLPGALALAALAVVVSFYFPTLESGYLLVSLLTLLLVSVALRRSGGAPVALILAAMLAMTLAGTALFDSLDVTLFGKGHDGGGGFLVGLVLATLFLLRIGATLLKESPKKRLYLLLAGLLFIILAQTFFFALDPAISLTAGVAAMTCLLLLLPALRRTSRELSYGQRLLLNGALVYAFANCLGSLQGSIPVVALGVGLLWILAARQARTANLPPESWAAVCDRIMVAVGIMVFLVLGVPALGGPGSDDLLLVAWLVAILPLLRLIYLAGGRLSAFFSGSLLFILELATLTVQTMVLPLPKNMDILFRSLLTGLLLTLWLRSVFLRWRAGIRPFLFSGTPAVARWSLFGLVTGAVQGTAVALLAVCFYLAVQLMITNTSPTRLLASHADAWYWPGLPLFITLAAHDDYLYRDAVPWSWPTATDPDRLIEQLTKAAPERFSYYTTPKEEDREARRDPARNKLPRPTLGIDMRKSGAVIKVSMVFQDSPADRAGLERGDILRAVDHREVPWRRLCREEGRVVLLTVQDRHGTTRDVPLICAPPATSPSFARIIPTPDEPVGYLYVYSFENKGYAGTQEGVALLAKAGITDLVLDLRDNPGGKMHNEVELAGMLLGSRYYGRLLHRYDFGNKYRDKNQEVEVRPTSVSLPVRRLVVITTEDSCSASEALINDLKPFLKLQTIGTTTCGKPMMMDAISIGEESSGGKLSLISALMSNSTGSGGYFAGIRPDYPAKDKIIYNLGDRRENLLQGALRLLESDGGAYP